MMQMTDLTGFQRDSMWVLADVQPAIGTELREALEEEIGQTINHGRFYPNMDDLVDEGLVVKHENMPDKRTNTYELSEEGRSLLKTRHDWEFSRMSKPSQVIAD